MPMRTLLLGSALAGALIGGSATAQSTGWQVEALTRGAGEPSLGRLLDIETPASVRHAIVIGNSSYAAIPDLPNAIADARAISAFLADKGYEVRQYEDLTKRGFEEMLRRALFDIDNDTEVVVFFAGHGFQIGSENYLVPVDADLDSIYDVPFEAVSLGSLVSIVGARARLQLVILDSCRDNPFAGREALVQIGNELRETRTGFSSQAAPLNSMLVFSTSPGTVAFDGEGENSPFTEALLGEAAARPNAQVKDVFEAVRRAVWRSTGGRQVPWDSSTLVEPVSFGLAQSPARSMNERAAPVARGLVLVTANSLDIAEIELPFAGTVEIGPALAEVLGTGPEDRVRLVGGPDVGRLIGGATPTRSLRGAEIAGADVPSLLYQGESVQTPALTLAGGVIRDTLEFEVNGVLRRIDLRLVPNPCDFEAGDHLDPDGMGITRYPNEIQPERALAACRAAVAESPETGRFHYQLGRALTALRRFDEAQAAFETARELGHARAYYALGSAVLNAERQSGGRFETRAPDEALRLLALGVEAGDPYAFHSLGRQFMRHGGRAEVELEGYDLMMRALEVGHTFAMNELGFFYLDEDSQYYDPPRGLRYLRESAAREDIYGFNNMGLVHLRGLGGEAVDGALAHDFFTRAAEGGHPTAPGNLARIYREGLLDGRPDIGRAVEWYLEGLERGDALAGGNGAFLIATERPEGYALHDAAVVAAKAAALSNQPAAERARAFLASLPSEAIDAGAQALISTLGAPVQIDGAFGASSQAAMDTVLESRGAGSAETEPLARLLQLASLYWATSPFRVDLY